jgi:hypothetical protein
MPPLCRQARRTLQPQAVSLSNRGCDALSWSGGGAASYGGSHAGGGARVTSIYDSEGPFGGGGQPPAARHDAASGIDYDNDYTGSGAPLHTLQVIAI